MVSPNFFLEKKLTTFFSHRPLESDDLFQLSSPHCRHGTGGQGRITIREATYQITNVRRGPFSHTR